MNQVLQLREFRDNYLLHGIRESVHDCVNVCNYTFDPAVAIFIDPPPPTKPPMQVILTPLPGILTP